MASTFGLTITRDDMIAAILRTLGKLGKTASASAYDKTNVSQALNLMVKSWVNKGATLWKITELTIPVIPNLVLYPIGPTAGYLATAGITITSGGTGGTAGTYALTITDTTGTGATGTYTIASGAIIAITITSPGSSYSQSPVLTFPLGGISGVTYTITTSGLTTDRPVRILDVGNFIRNNATTQDTTITALARYDYMVLGQKSPSGSIPNQFFFNPLLGNAQLSVYPPGQSGINYSLHLFAQVLLGDSIASTDTFDFPQEFLNCVKWGGCRELMTEYGVDDATERRIERMYAQYVEEAFSFSVEEPSSYFTYSTRQGGDRG